MTVLESPERAQERLLVKVQPRCSRELNILGVSVLWDDHQEQSRCGVELAGAQETSRVCGGWQTWRSVASQAPWIPEDHEFQTSDMELYMVGPWFCLYLNVSVRWFLPLSMAVCDLVFDFTAAHS